MSLIDGFGRTVNYLRLSVTDRCNFRCTYCMPAEGVPSLGHEEILSYEELLLVAEAAVSLGVEKIRITGGEPLVRKGIADFLKALGSLKGLRHLVLTTNGHRLPEMAELLREAGVQRLNVSLDSLQPETFARITRGGELLPVLHGIRAAELAGIPLKLNMVVMRGINDHEIVDFAAMTLRRRIVVRFIEFMPAAAAEGWQSLLVPGDEIIGQVKKRFALREIPRDDGLLGPARNYQIDGASGMIGFITPISGHFCSECNRIRVTASGCAKSCLFGGDVVDLKPILRSGAGIDEIASCLRSLVQHKPRQHAVTTGMTSSAPFTMARIGG